METSRSATDADWSPSSKTFTSSSPAVVHPGSLSPSESAQTGTPSSVAEVLADTGPLVQRAVSSITAAACCWIRPVVVATTSLAKLSISLWGNSAGLNCTISQSHHKLSRVNRLIKCTHFDADKVCIVHACSSDVESLVGTHTVIPWFTPTCRQVAWLSIMPALAICRCCPSGYQVMPTGLSRLSAHVSGMTHRPMWRLLSHYGLHFASGWKPISSHNHSMAISWTLSNIFGCYLTFHSTHSGSL